MKCVQTVFLDSNDRSVAVSGTRPTTSDFMNLPTYALCGWKAYHASYSGTNCMDSDWSLEYTFA